MRKSPLLCSLLLFASCSAAPAALAAAAVVAKGVACTALGRQSVPAAAKAALLASFPSAPRGLLRDSAYVYDNAVAAIALLGCGDTIKARHIGDAFLHALERDRFWHDGRLRNAYAAGPTGTAPMRMAGLWDATQKRWVEDSYQAGSDTGNQAWAMLALLQLHNVTRDARYLAGARRLAAWLETRADTRGAGGFRGGMQGFEPNPLQLSWKSTEHNIDLYAAFAQLAHQNNDVRWRNDAQLAQKFVAAMWQADCGCYAAGTTTDGSTLNHFLALDVQVWAELALPGDAAKRPLIQGTLDRKLRATEGYTYSEAGHVMWTEGTAQVELLLRVAGRKADADALHAIIERQRTADGGLYATDGGDLDTGLAGRTYLHLSHLGASAWAALGETGFNPF